MPTERQDEARSSFGIWAIVDAAGEMLYGSNVRQEVEAEYERRLAADPRLVRVLRIAELDISFAGRGEAEEEGEEQTICVLPWLPLDEPLRFGAVRVDHWTEARRGLPDDVCQTADALLAGFRDHHGGEIDPVVCWLDGQPPAEKLSTVDVDRVRMHTFVLTLAGIAENTYLHDYEQLNASHCRRVFLHFRVGRPEIRTTRRRREGWAISRLRYSRVLLARPLAAEGRPTAAGEHPLMTLYRQHFLDALASCVDADDALSRAIRQSVVPFLRANDMDEYGSPEQDVVWLVAALEQLVGVARQVEAGRRGSQLAQQIADLFPGWPRGERSLFRRWMTHLHSKRHEIHGRPATEGKWQIWAHALLATLLYPLVAKALLAQEGRYVFDAWDVRLAAAFPVRVRMVEGLGEFDQQALCAAWHQALVDADPSDGRIARTP